MFFFSKRSLPKTTIQNNIARFLVTNKINDHNTRERSIRKPSIRKILKEGTTQPFSSGTAPKRAEVLTTTRTTSSSIVGQVMEPVDLIDVEDYTTQETRFRRAGGGKSKKTKNINKKQSREKKKKSKKRVKPVRIRYKSCSFISSNSSDQKNALACKTTVQF